MFCASALSLKRRWGFWVGRSEKAAGAVLPATARAQRRCATFLKTPCRLKDSSRSAVRTMRKCPAIGEPVWSDESSIEMLIASCRLALARYRKRLAENEIRSIEAPVSSLAAKSNVHPVTNDLLRAIRQRNVDSFAHAVNRVQDLDKGAPARSESG